MTQLTFSDPSLLFDDLDPGVVDRFVDYHKRHPETYETFKRFAYRIKRRHSHFSARDIWGTVRYFSDIPSENDIKANNSHVSCYVRLLIWEDPQFKNFFETRHTPGIIFEKAA